MACLSAPNKGPCHPPHLGACQVGQDPGSKQGGTEGGEEGGAGATGREALGEPPLGRAALRGQTDLGVGFLKHANFLGPQFENLIYF